MVKLISLIFIIFVTVESTFAQNAEFGKLLENGISALGIGNQVKHGHEIVNRSLDLGEMIRSNVHSIQLPSLFRGPRIERSYKRNPKFFLHTHNETSTSNSASKNDCDPCGSSKFNKFSAKIKNLLEKKKKYFASKLNKTLSKFSSKRPCPTTIVTTTEILTTTPTRPPTTTPVVTTTKELTTTAAPTTTTKKITTTVPITTTKKPTTTTVPTTTTKKVTTTVPTTTTKKATTTTKKATTTTKRPTTTAVKTTKCPGYKCRPPTYTQPPVVTTTRRNLGKPPPIFEVQSANDDEQIEEGIEEMVKS